MTTSTRSRKSPASTPEVDLPPVLQNDDAPAAIAATKWEPQYYASMVVSVRYFDPQTGRTFAIHFADLDLPAIELHCDDYERRGYVPCQSPDAPLPAGAAPSHSSSSRDGEPIDRRAGQRQAKPKDARLVLPFALKGEYKGWTLDAIEEENPSAIDWIAKNSFMADIKKAAQKIVNQRNDEPF